MININNADNADNADNNIVKCKMYILEGVGWVGSILVLIPYVVHFYSSNRTYSVVFKDERCNALPLSYGC